MTNQNETATSFLEKKGSLRAMFYNVDGYDRSHNNVYLTHGGPISIRLALQTETVQAYSPDVIGFQEYVNVSHKSLTPMISALGYREVPYTLPEGDKVNDTPIFYKDGKLSLIESGYHLFSESVESVEVPCNNAFTKSFSWAIFEQKADGKKFIFISAHFMYTADKSAENRHKFDYARQANAEELLAVLDGICEKYPTLPVIVGGDLNCHFGSIPFKKLQSRLTWMQEADGVNADTCGYKGNAIYSLETQDYTFCPTPPETGYGIDHVFFDGNVTAINYITLTNRASLLASDHCPKLVDLILN